MRKLRAGVEILDKDYQLVLIQTELNESWICQYWLGLFIGIICLIISLAWWIHM